MSGSSLSQNSATFLAYLEDWLAALPVLAITRAVPHPAQAAIASVDVTVGFCYSGALSSPRVARIVPPLVDLFQTAHACGLREFLLIQDSHDPQAVEFGSFPPHCVRGSGEAEPVDEIKSLPFFGQMTILEKNSIAAEQGTGLDEWIAAHPHVDTYIVTGDCTDICVYQLAMYLRTNANARQLQRRVIVPLDCVATYDRSVETARLEGGFPHPGDLLHAVFLYHMALNGIEVVQRIG